MTITVPFISIVLILCMAVFFLALYLVRLQHTMVFMFNNSEKAYANIRVMLQQRFEELPNQLSIAGELLAHERELLDQLNQLRSECVMRKNFNRTVDAHNQVATSLRRYAARLEDYPTLNTDSASQLVMRRLTEFENSIANQRAFYNEAVNLYNDKLNVIPNQPFAYLFGFKPLQLLTERDD